MQMARLSKIVLAIVLAIQCAGTFDHSLWSPDEPRVAEIAREMAASGDYLIPHFSRQPFLEQPPLYYATAALGFRFFGTVNEGSGRLASVFYGILTLLVVFAGVRRLFSEETAWLSIAVLASSSLFFQVTHKMRVDSALVFFVTLTLFGFLLAFQGHWRHGYKLFWLGMGLAFLTKGLMWVAIPIVAVAVFIIWQADFTVIRRIWAAPGILLLLIVMGLWTWVLYYMGGTDFLWTFYGYNQLGRFFNNGIYTGGHVRPMYYYLADFWAQGAPWSLLIIPFFITARPLDATKRFLIAWLLSGIVLLSLALTKRGLYLLPLMPAMAVMVAIWISDMSRRRPKRWEMAVLYSFVVLCMLCFFGLAYGYVYVLGGQWTIAAAVMGACLLALWFIYSTCKPNQASLLVVGWCLSLLLWTPAVSQQIDQHKSYKDLFMHMGRIVADQPVVGYQLTETVEALSLFYGGFYTENIEERHAFEQFLARKPHAYAIVLPSRLDAGLQARLQANGVRIIRDEAGMRRTIELWKIGTGQAGGRN